MDENKKLLIAALVVLLGSNAGSVVNSVMLSGAKNSFSELEASKLERRLEQRIYKLEYDVRDLQSRHDKDRRYESGK